MIVNILGFLDLWTAAVLVPLHFGILPVHLVIFHSAYLFIKGILFWGELYSLLDVGISIYILAMVLGVANIVLTLIACMYLLQKSIFSLRTC